jgi:carbon storage regulator
MLVLTRRKDESIHIGDDVVVNVAEIRKGQVKLTIDAPRHVPVYRSELRERMTASATSAARSSLSQRAGIRPVSLQRGVFSRPSAE